MSYSGYDFCPKCGALVRNGVCTSCGNKISAEPQEESNTPVEEKNLVSYEEAENNGEEKIVVSSDYGYVPNPLLHQEKKNYTPAIIICIVLFLGLFGVAIWWTGSGKTHKVSSASTTYDTKSDNPDKPLVNTRFTYDGDFKDYIEDNFYMFADGNAKYMDSVDYEDENEFYLYSDYIRTDLHYYIKNQEWGFYNPSGTWDTENETFPHNLFIYGSCPVLCDTGLSNEDEVNTWIRQLSENIYDLYANDFKYLERNQEYYSEANFYVTYMDESTISVAFVYDGYIYEDKETDNTDDNYNHYSSTMAAINIGDLDKQKAVIIDQPEGLVLDSAFADRFIEEVNAFYETDITEDVSKEKLLHDLKHGSFVWFYSPIGVEYAYNFDDYSGTYSFTERY